MAYTPQNVNVFSAAFAGALAGMTTSGLPTDPVSADYINITNVALQFAESFDTAWGATFANQYHINCILGIAQSVWDSRTPPTTTPFTTTPGTFTSLCNALIGIVNEGQTILVGQGVNPSHLGANWASVMGVSGATLGTIHSQTSASSTGVLAMVLNPQSSGVFDVGVRLTYSDGTTAGSITHSLVTKQGGAGNVLAGTGFLAQVKTSTFPGSGTSGGILNADASGGAGITFGGSGIGTFTIVQANDVQATLTGLLTANGIGTQGFAWRGLIDATGDSSGTKTPFTIGLPCCVGVALTSTAAHVITYDSIEMFATELQA